MLNLLLNVVIGIVAIAIVWWVSSLLLPHTIALVVTLVVALLVLVYLARGHSPIV